MTCARCKQATPAPTDEIGEASVTVDGHEPGVSQRYTLCQWCWRDVAQFLTTPVDARCQDTPADGSFTFGREICIRRAVRKVIADNGCVLKLCRWHHPQWLRNGMGWRDAGPMSGAPS